MQIDRDIPAIMSARNLKFINPCKRRTFAPVENWICVRYELNGTEKVVYARLCQFSDENGVAYPTIETLAKACGIQKRTCERVIKKLRELGLIYVRKNNLTKSNEYLFLDHPWMDESVNPEVVKDIHEDSYKPNKTYPSKMSDVRTDMESDTTILSQNIPSKMSDRKDNIEKKKIYINKFIYTKKEKFLDKVSIENAENICKSNSHANSDIGDFANRAKHAYPEVLDNKYYVKSIKALIFKYLISPLFLLMPNFRAQFLSTIFIFFCFKMV